MRQPPNKGLLDFGISRPRRSWRTCGRHPAHARGAMCPVPIVGHVYLIRSAVLSCLDQGHFAEYEGIDDTFV